MPTIEKANEIDDRPVVIDFRTDCREKVYPMVPAGASNDDIILGPRVRRGRSMTDERAATHHILRLVENKPGVLAARRGPVRPPRASTSSRSRSAPTDDERFSRMTIVVDAESAPLEQIVKQLNKLIPVIKITELAPARRGRARAAAGDRAGRRPRPRGQVTELAAIFEGKIVDVGYDALTIMARGRSPTSSTPSSDLLQPFGIVELQRTGRIALPKLARQPASCVRSRPLRLPDVPTATNEETA